MNNFSFVLFTVLLLVRTASAEPVLKIGVIASLTGNAAAWGEDVRNSVLFATKRFGHGRVEVKIEDDQCLGKNAVTAAQKLINVDHIDIGMVVCTESTLATSPLFEKGATLLITPVASGAAVSQAGDFVFRMWPSDNLAAKKLYLHLSPSTKVLAVLTEDRGYSSELTDAFMTASAGSSLVVKNETYASDTTDFRTILLRLKSSNPDALFINTNGEGLLVTILKQIRDLDWKVRVYGVYMPGSPAFLERAGGLAEGIEFVDAPSADRMLTEEGKQLYAEYEREYGSLRSSSFVFAATVEAVRRSLALSENRKNWRRELYEGKYSGIFGDYSFDQNGDIVGVQHVVKKIVSGRPVLMK